MRAVVYHGPGDVRLDDVPEPKPGRGDLLIEVATVGICGSDLGEYVHDPLFFPIRERHPHSGHFGPTVVISTEPPTNSSCRMSSRSMFAFITPETLWCSPSA